MDAAKNAKAKPEIERALKRADEIKKKIDDLKRRMGERAPAERVSYTSNLASAYHSKNPFDLVYDKVSVTLCGKRWEGAMTRQYPELSKGS